MIRLIKFGLLPSFSVWIIPKFPVNKSSHNESGIIEMYAGAFSDQTINMCNTIKVQLGKDGECHQIVDHIKNKGKTADVMAFKAKTHKE